MGPRCDDKLRALTKRKKVGQPDILRVIAKNSKEIKNWILQCCIYTLITLTSGLYYKSFTIVINDRNNNGLYFKNMIVANLTMIIATLALARSVNYDRKVSCKLKHTFTIINYGSKPFIVQATGLNNFAINCKIMLS